MIHTYLGCAHSVARSLRLDICVLAAPVWRVCSGPCFSMCAAMRTRRQCMGLPCLMNSYARNVVRALADESRLNVATPQEAFSLLAGALARLLLRFFRVAAGEIRMAKCSSYTHDCLNSTWVCKRLVGVLEDGAVEALCDRWRKGSQTTAASGFNRLLREGPSRPPLSFRLSLCPCASHDVLFCRRPSTMVRGSPGPLVPIWTLPSTSVLPLRFSSLLRAPSFVPARPRGQRVLRAKGVLQLLRPEELLFGSLLQHARVQRCQLALGPLLAARSVGCRTRWGVPRDGCEEVEKAGAALPPDTPSQAFVGVTAQIGEARSVALFGDPYLHYYRLAAGGLIVGETFGHSADTFDPCSLMWYRLRQGWTVCLSARYAMMARRQPSWESQRQAVTVVPMMHRAKTSCGCRVPLLLGPARSHVPARSGAFAPGSRVSREVR